jgi:hypothetical protein
MKHLLIIIIFFIQANGKTYCDGFEDGYKRGWCYNDPNCITPIVPPCGIPRVNFNTYEGGFEDGFILGKKDRKKP